MDQWDFMKDLQIKICQKKGFGEGGGFTDQNTDIGEVVSFVMWLKTEAWKRNK